MAKLPRGYCGGCGYLRVINKDGKIRAHGRLMCGGTRYPCHGTWKPPVGLEAAMRAMLGKGATVAAVDPVGELAKRDLTTRVANSFED